MRYSHTFVLCTWKTIKPQIIFRIMAKNTILHILDCKAAKRLIYIAKFITAKVTNLCIVDVYQIFLSK